MDFCDSRIAVDQYEQFSGIAKRKKEVRVSFYVMIEEYCARI